MRESKQEATEQDILVVINTQCHKQIRHRVTVSYILF